MNLKRSISNLSKRLDKIIESKDSEDDDIAIEAKFAKLRGQHAKKTDAFGNKTYEDVLDDMTQEHIDYYKRKSLEISPEQRYQDKKANWYG